MSERGAAGEAVIVEVVIAVHTVQCKLIEGRCVVCSCTDDHACPGGCSWVDLGHLLCSACFARAQYVPGGPLPLGPIVVQEQDRRFFDAIRDATQAVVAEFRRVKR